MSSHPSGTKLLAGMNADEIVEVFRRYNFQDQFGHDLINCLEFQELIKIAADNRGRFGFDAGSDVATNP